jgi:hypothetical protein
LITREKKGKEKGTGRGTQREQRGTVKNWTNRREKDGK